MGGHAMEGGMGCSTAKKGKKGKKGSKKGAKKGTQKRGRGHAKSQDPWAAYYKGGGAQYGGYGPGLVWKDYRGWGPISQCEIQRAVGVKGHVGGKAHQNISHDRKLTDGIYPGQAAATRAYWNYHAAQGHLKGGKKQATRTAKSGKKGGEQSRKSRRRSRSHRGGKSAAGASPATQGFQNLLTATDTIEQLEAHQKALQQQKIAAASKYHADQKALSKAAEQDVMKPGMGLLNAMRQQAANTSEKTTAGFKAGAFLRS